MKNTVFILAAFFVFNLCSVDTIAQQAKAQPTKTQQEVNVWQILSMVMMEKKFDEEMGIDVEKPRYGKKVKALNGQEVTVKGYILPLRASKNQKYFILSAVPFNQCFFCGGAGRESVMEVFSEKLVKPSDKMVEFKGTLAVNINPSIGQVLYTLRNAEIVK